MKPKEIKPAIDKHGLTPEERRLAQVLPDEIGSPREKAGETTCYFAAVIEGVKVEISGPSDKAVKLISRLRGE